MAKVSIEIDSRWVRIVRSPLYWVVATLQGVSVSFAPLFLYWSGKGMFPSRQQWIVVPACFATIYLVGLFYMGLGGVVIAELRKKPPAS
jgi:hypothetical protein